MNPRCMAGMMKRSLAAMAMMALTIGLTTRSANAQAAEPTLFVSNNGNLIGSISSMHIHADGTLELIDHLVTGQRNSTSEPCPGCNAYAIDITPDGRYLATGHASSSSHPISVSITRVDEDGALELVTLVNVPHSPLDVRWLDDEHFAVARANLSGGNNQILVYRYNRENESASLQNFQFTNGFSTSLAVDRENKRLFAQRSSGGSAVLSFSYDQSGTLTLIDTYSTGTTYPLGIGISPDGLRLYGGGGISNGGDKIVGARVSPDGTLGDMTGAPFTSPGASPKQVVVTGDGQFAVAGHGTDATVRTFAIDQASGALSATGFFFDIGAQGTLGNIATAGHLLFAADTSTVFDGVMGVYSFTVEADGSLTPNGSIVDTEGIAPRDFAPWQPAECPADLSGNGVVEVEDLFILLASWGPCPGCPADLTGSGEVDADDLFILLAEWGPCPD